MFGLTVLQNTEIVEFELFQSLLKPFTGYRKLQNFYYFSLIALRATCSVFLWFNINRDIIMIWHSMVLGMRFLLLCMLGVWVVGSLKTS